MDTYYSITLEFYHFHNSPNYILDHNFFIKNIAKKLPALEPLMDQSHQSHHSDTLRGCRQDFSGFTFVSVNLLILRELSWSLVMLSEVNQTMKNYLYLYCRNRCTKLPKLSEFSARINTIVISRSSPLQD